MRPSELAPFQPLMLLLCAREFPNSALKVLVRLCIRGEWRGRVLSSLWGHQPVCTQQGGVVAVQAPFGIALPRPVLFRSPLIQQRGLFCDVQLFGQSPAWGRVSLPCTPHTQHGPHCTFPSSHTLSCATDPVSGFSCSLTEGARNVQGVVVLSLDLEICSQGLETAES